MLKSNKGKIGSELRSIRLRRNLTIYDLSEQIGISENYLSLIERDKKIPTDEKIVYNIAKAYDIDTAYLFGKFNKVPSVLAGEIASHVALQATLLKISNDDRLDEEKKERLYQQFQRLYQETIED